MQGARGASLSGDAESIDPSGRPRRVGVLALVAGFIVLLDQVTKVMAVEWLGAGQVVQVVDGFLQLRLVRNPGAAFSIGVDYTAVLAVLVLVVIGAILRMSRRLVSLPWAVALGGLLGGAIGNFIDRLFRAPGPMRGHVVDFLELPNWPVFNVADSAVVGGAILVVILSLRGITHDGSGAEPSSGGRE